MTTDRPDPTTREPQPEPEPTRREERQGWLFLTAIFVGGGLLVAVAAVAT